MAMPNEPTMVDKVGLIVTSLGLLAGDFEKLKAGETLRPEQIERNLKMVEITAKMVVEITGLDNMEVLKSVAGHLGVELEGIPV